MARLDGGTLFVRDDGLLFVYGFKHSHTHFDTLHTEDLNLRHAFLLAPKGMQPCEIEEGELLQGYGNYFLGNDPSRWKSRVSAFGSLLYRNVYEGVDWKIYSSDGQVKHEFIVHAGADPQMVELLYRGVERMELKDGNLHLKLAVGEVVEQKPYAYQVLHNANQLADEQTQQIPISFTQRDDAIGYTLGSYDKTRDLIIDPALVFSTYSGSVSDNWGFTAAYDDEGNLYAGSITSGSGYPTTLGAFSDTFGGVWDCVVTKFSSDGTQMIYSTYFGGAQSEMPHSMIVNRYGELVVFGTTGSLNFPTTANAYQPMFAGGTTVTYDGSVQFPFGTDIYVSKFSSDGTQLAASTYIGGSENDGLNYREIYNTNQMLTYLGNDSLYANYGDGARGELITDDQNNIYVGSSTFSYDFPVTPNAFQQNSLGAQEGIVFKLDYTLSTLLFSSYLGGSNDDAVFSIDTDESYRLYVTGGTVSTDFPTTQGAYRTTHSGGATDAFLALVSYNGSTLLASSYFGSEEFDLAYFVRTDRAGNPHIFGQTKAQGSTLVHNAAYNIPSSGQFIAKFSPLIDTLVFSTVFGTGDNEINISPTGFSVDVCGRIYASGWGRKFRYLPNLPSVFGTMNMQITPDAYQSQTDGQDFYIISLPLDASALDYATFFGEIGEGTHQGNDHVDGGTSRFDRYGNLYQVVCASCGGTQGFPIAPSDAWSDRNASSNCNAAAFKFNIHSDFPVADFTLPDFVCYPDSVHLTNVGRGDMFYWDFGDGTFSTQASPVHHYAESGRYNITLIAYMGSGCRTSDTLTRPIILLDAECDTLDTVYVCPDEQVQIGIMNYPSNQVSFQWQPSAGLSSANVPNPYANVTEATTYRLIITTPECSDTLVQHIAIRNVEADFPDSVDYCNMPYDLQLPETLPESVSVEASWQRDFSQTVSAQNGVITLDTARSAWIFLSLTEGNCTGLDSIYMNYTGGTLQLNVHPARCSSESNGYATVSAQGFAQPVQYTWSCGESGTEVDSVGGLSAGSYSLTVIDANDCRVSVNFEVQSPYEITVNESHTDNNCQNQCVGSISLSPSGGVAPYNILWSNETVGEELSDLCSGQYIYVLTDAAGCTLTDTVQIRDLDTIKLSLDATLNNCPEGCGAVITPTLTGGTLPYAYAWSNGETTATIEDVCCGDYALEVADANGCRENAQTSVGYVDAFENFSLHASEERVFDGQQVRLWASRIDGMHYYWQPSEHLTAPYSHSTLATMYETTVFHLLVTDRHGCELKDSILIEVDYVNCGKPNIHVPNIFTPNGDGVNDVLYVSGNWMESLEFEIFDRWGEKVFSTDDATQGWDGTFNGRACDAAVYFYKLEVHCSGGKTYVTGGDITLVR